MDDLIEFLVPAGIAALLVGLIAWTCHLVFQESREWEKFKTDHSCQVVSRIKGDTFNTFNIGPNGQPTVGIAATPDKTGWKCDDGVTYYR